MHELSLCQNIIKTVDQVVQVQNLNKTQTMTVQVKLGELAGVDQESLSFWFPTVAKEMQYKNLSLQIQNQAGQAKCQQCQRLFSLHSHLQSCPNCQSFEHQLLSGDEFLVLGLKIG